MSVRFSGERYTTRLGIRLFFCRRRNNDEPWKEAAVRTFWVKRIAGRIIFFLSISIVCYTTWPWIYAQTIFFSLTPFSCSHVFSTAVCVRVDFQRHTNADEFSLLFARYLPTAMNCDLDQKYQIFTFRYGSRTQAHRLNEWMRGRETERARTLELWILIGFYFPLICHAIKTIRLKPMWAQQQKKSANKLDHNFFARCSFEMFAVATRNDEEKQSCNDILDSSKASFCWLHSFFSFLLPLPLALALALFIVAVLCSNTQ